MGDSDDDFCNLNPHRVCDEVQHDGNSIALPHPKVRTRLEKALSCSRAREAKSKKRNDRNTASFMSNSKHLVRATCSKRTARKYDSALKVGRRGTDFALRKFQKLVHSAAGRRRRAAKHSIDKLLTHAFEPSLDTTAAGRIHEVEGVDDSDAPTISRQCG